MKWMTKTIFLLAAALAGCNHVECNKSVSQSSIDDVDQAQLQADGAAIDAYIAENNITDVQELNGIRMVVSREGANSGTPCLENSVVVTYVGRRLDGVIFDQSSDPVSLKLGSLILGWQIALTTFKEGTEARLFIPSVYGYGASGIGNEIPPDTNLIFDIELHAIR